MTLHDHREYVPGCYRCELGRDEARDAEADKIRELLEEVAVSGVAFDDSRIGYVEVQIDRDTWTEIQEWKATR